MLRAIIHCDLKKKSPLTQTVLELYLRIHALYLTSEGREDSQKKVM
jgi:hypothetical protein